MPVYLITCHAYRSWSEDNPRGYVQHGVGLRPPNPKLARYRANQAHQHPQTFSDVQKELLLDVVEERTADVVRLETACCTPTHLHMLVTFETPRCDCGATEYCAPTCDARQHAEALATGIKRLGGLRLGRASSIRGQKWFSHGWDIKPVRDRQHFDHLIGTYLPEHRKQAGIVRIYRKR